MFTEQLPKSSRELHIKNCPLIKEYLPETLDSLNKLVICSCQQLVPSLPQASNLKFLEMGGSFTDGAFSEKIEYTLTNTRLEEFKIDQWQNIRRYNSVRSFPLDLFPSLQDLELRDCSNLEMISMSDGHDQNPMSLERLKIYFCPKFVSFPEVWLPKLGWCEIVGLDNLEAPPECMASLLPSLYGLRIRHCPQLESFREGSLPSNLEMLEIKDCPKVTAPRMKWGLQHHKSLLGIAIGDADIQSFPDQGLLPPSLTYLTLSKCSNLMRLDYKGLCHLSSLKEVQLWLCPRLQCLPEEGLPSSLRTLHILDCSLLKERCKKEKGKDWGKIAHIPCVQVDDDILT